MIGEHLLTALKQQLRKTGVGYKGAALALGLSESSIKRLFAEQSFTLARLEKLCELVGTDLAGLVQLAEASQAHIDQLSIAQEQAIIDDPRLLLIGVCVLNHCAFHEILEKYDFKETELIRLFVRLEKLDILAFLPGNRYRLKISSRFKWQPGGPIQNFFMKNLVQEYLAYDLKSRPDQLHYLWGMLTQESAKELHRRILRLVDEFVQAAQRESKLPMNEKLTSSLMILFREDWEPEHFKALWRS